MKNLTIIASLFLLSCTTGVESPQEITKAQAADIMAEKGDGADLCEEFGWYLDDVCDTFCPNPDPACSDGEPELDCFRSGCGGEICSDQSIVTTCEFKPETVCLEGAECTFQTDSQSCGFTQTPELVECLEEITAGEDVWLTLNPTQCGTNPWQQSPAETSGFSHLNNELASIAAYYVSQGMPLEALGLVNHTQPINVCLACSCPRGDRLVVRANAMVAQSLKAVGFSKLKGALSTLPIQCGGNDWESFNASNEAEKVTKWSASMGAKIEELGFIVNAEQTFTCLACSCPRGDELVVLPATGSDAAILESAGLGQL